MILTPSAPLGFTDQYSILKCNTISDKSDTLHVAVHERLGEVLRILRSVLERYPALHSSELLVTAGTLIQHVKGNMLVDFSVFRCTVKHCIQHITVSPQPSVYLHHTVHLLVNDYNYFLLKPVGQILFYVKTPYTQNCTII
jgi:hypothetical protein